MGIMKQNTGTNADGEGHFKLFVNSLKNDTIVISSVGYTTLKIPVDKISSNMLFELQPKEAILKKVIITGNHHSKTTTLGKSSICGSHYYVTTNYINQVAQHFKTDQINSFLSEIEICKYGIALIDPARTKFRVRIYSMDSLTKAPASDLCDSIIELDVTGRRIKVNLEKYQITIAEKDFFVAVEWLRIPMNEEKEKSKSSVQKKVYSIYNPSLAIKTGLNVDLTLENWQLDYRGNCIPFHLDNKSVTLMISATIKN